MDSISGIGGAGGRHEIKKPAGGAEGVQGSQGAQASAPTDIDSGRQAAPSDQVSVSDEAHEDSHSSQAAGDSATHATGDSATDTTSDTATHGHDKKKGAEGADSHEHINALRDGIKGKPKAKPAEAWGGCDE